MIVVDSSAWIEWLIGSEIGKALQSEIPPPSECIVPTIVQFEVVKWLRRETDDDKADAFLAFTMECEVVPLTTEIAMAAVALSMENKLAMADAVVMATAVTAGAMLLTCDAHFEAVEGVIFISKRQT